MRSTTWTTRRESRMLLLAMAFLMVIAALVAFPAAEADAQTVGARCDAKVLLVLDETTSLTNNGATWDVSLAGAVSDFLAYVDLNYDGVQVAAMAFSSPAGSGNLTGWPRVGTGYTAEAAAIDAESLFGYTAVDGQAGALAASIDAAHNPGVNSEGQRTQDWYTNWEDAFTSAASWYGPSDMLLFFTDGNPNTVADGANGDAEPGGGINNAADNVAGAAAAAAVSMAGSYPHDNIVGVGLWTGTGAFETRLAAVTDSHVVVDDDAGLKAAFAAVATQICTPKLTLTKHVENAPNGENAGSWTLIASGTSDEEFVSGVEESVAPDTYTLSETGPTEGWSDGGWSCTNATEGGTDVSGGSPVTLALGDDVTCEITNTYTPREPDPDLKVEKDDPSITYNDDGSVTATFKITVTNLTDQETEYELEDVEQFWDGYTVVSGPDLVFDDDASDEPDAVVEPTGDAASGTLVGLSDVHIYTATFEISGEMNVYGPGDGEFDDWSYCDGDGSGLWNEATISWGDGQYDDSDWGCDTLDMPRLTLDKVVVGGSAEPDDWCLFASGFVGEQTAQALQVSEDTIYYEVDPCDDEGWSDGSDSEPVPFFSGPGGASSLIAAGQPYALGEMYMPDDSGDAGYVESWACYVDTEDGPGASFPMTQISEWGPGVSVGWGEEVICVATNRKPGTTTTTTTPTVVPVLDLQIDKTGVVTEDILEADGVATVEWTLTVSHGPGSNINAVGATITDPAPAGMTFTGVTSAEMVCAIVDNAVSCGPFNLDLGETAMVKVTATTAQPGTFDNTATVTVLGDSVESNNVDDAAVEISEVLPLEILPETGADSDRIAWTGGILLLMGAALVLGSRRGESVTAESTL